MSDIRLVLINNGEQAERPADATYTELAAADIADGTLCPCGDMIGGHRTTLAAPTRESGAPRGICRCFRARARQVPAGARR